ncbi:MAG: hypothetical protein ACFB5Z_02490 [Elainellaceae cyanobacterium]
MHRLITIPFVLASPVGYDSPDTARQIVVAQSEFSEIDVANQNETFEELLTGSESSIEAVLTSPDDFNPPVLYALSRALFESGREEEAMFWFYTGQLRARSDANKSLDVSARAAVDVLNREFGTPINQYAFGDIERLRSTVEAVVARDRAASRSYDPRWILLHGMDAFSGETIRFEPESQWLEIDEQTRVDYLNGFYGALESLQ